MVVPAALRLLELRPLLVVVPPVANLVRDLATAVFFRSFFSCARCDFPHFLRFYEDDATRTKFLSM